MKLACVLAAAGMTALVVGSAHGAVIITEIMYNPAGADPGTADISSEWVEIYNTGPAAVDVSGWKLDDEDAAAWGPIADGSMLEPGEAAILSNVADEFKQTWGAGIKVFDVTWQSLANTGSATNEVLSLLDNNDVQVDLANYEVGGDWPPSTNGRSIYLKNFNLDNDLGTNWAQSQVGVDGAYSPTSAVNPPFDNRDVASPGYVVPEPASLLLAAGLSVMLLPRRRAA